MKRFAQNYAGESHNLSEQKPALYIVAGPMGAGKSTFYEAYLKEAFPTVVPPLRHLQQPFLDERRSFVVEDIHVDTRRRFFSFPRKTRN